ncbi:3-oxoacyl-[acyl-carrier-protein] reductase [Oscillatoria laete-virens NRMC-F 0139]|nr:3-oxoacyl-[acyl-carrier-protein] reductase [Oscillatoria laete-virens]MDL5053650.1 3-oxoacyl-[acyl-carrier-protein] reductase [Oscillatoria laete-virens NRMC-F 0139]
MEKSLTGKIALVTGAGRGIGKGIALKLAREGAKVIAVSQSDTSFKLVEEMRAEGLEAEAGQLNVADYAAVQDFAEKLWGVHGRLDIIVNNAGVTRDTLMMRMSEEDWDTVVDINLKGAFNVCKAFTRNLLKQKSGRIINISSIVGLIGNAGQVNYAASKAGLIGMSKSLAREFASRGVTVNVICPGFIETDMTGKLNDEIRQNLLAKIPLSRFGGTEDIANAVWFLASDMSAYMTGQVMTVDGGMVM